jgi:hypothetical protein
MKKFLLIAAILSASFACLAQTNKPAPPPAEATNVTQLLGLPASWASVGSLVESTFVDAEPYISNGIVTVEAGALYDSAAVKGRYGGFLDATVPMSQQSSIGIGAEYLNHKIIAGQVAVTLGTTTTLPVIGQVYAAVSTGPSVGFNGAGIGAYNFASARKKWQLSKSWTLTVGAGTGDVSQIPGEQFAGGFSLTKSFK